MGGRQPSSIDRLPPDVREQLQRLLRDPRVSQLDATAKINAILEADGHPERVSKSSVNRYALKMAEAGAKLRQSREVAEMWIGKLGAAPQGQVGHLVNEIIRTLSFDVSLMLQHGELDAESAPETVKMLKDLALTMMRLEKAATLNVGREKEIRKEALEQAADATEQTARTAGLSDATVDQIRRQILGIAG